MWDPEREQTSYRIKEYQAEVDEIRAQLAAEKKAREEAEKRAVEWSDRYRSVMNQSWSESNPRGWICATCGMSVEEGPCPEHGLAASTNALKARAEAAEGRVRELEALLNQYIA